MTITVNIPAGWQHAGAIFTPRLIPPDTKPRYIIRLPADKRFADCHITARDDVPSIAAKSERPPFIMIGDDSTAQNDLWSDILSKAAGYRMPLDFCLVGRPLRVIVDKWLPTGPHATGKHSLMLLAVNILGLDDPDARTFIDEKIDEIKSWVKE